MNHIINNRYIEFTFDKEEITSFNFNDIKKQINEKLSNEDEYDIIIFNMIHVKYMDSSGINFLLNIKKKTEKEIILKNCNETIIKVLEILNLQNMFEFFER